MQITFRQNEIELKSSLYRDRLSQLLQSDLDFRGKSSTYSSHAIHAFPAKFPPQIPRTFIENLTAPGEIVLDPMMGSGTTLLEAAILNRRAVGIDIDPLALRISHTKLNPNQVDILKEAGERASVNAQSQLQENPAGLLEKLHSRLKAENLEFINYWFLPATQLELLALLEEIESIQNDTVRSFLLLNFSAIIITKSGGVSLALDLAHTRPHRNLSKTIKPAILEFRKRLKKNLQNIADHDFKSVNFLTAEGNIENLPLSENSVDLIVTSPPYASNAIDYMRAHKFSLVWMGYPMSALSELRQKYIGGDALKGIHLLPLPDFSQAVIAQLAAVDNKKAQVLHRYYSEMTLALGEMYRVLKPGKAAVVVVGNSIMRGISTETDRCLGEIGKQAGFDLVHIGIRNLDRDKRMLPARNNGNRDITSQIEARMHQEYVLGFIKPEG